MNRAPKIGCFGTIGIAILFVFIWNWAQNIWFWVVLAVVIGGVFWYRWQSKNSKQVKLTQELLTMAALLDRQASIFEGKQGDPRQGNLAPKKGEEVLLQLNGVDLIEWRSNGSSYDGGNVGVSFRVAKGVNVGVGKSQGQLIKNPATQQVTDNGSATFTNQRVVFVGAQKTMQWEFDKLVGMDSGPNGLMVQIAVSNRSSNSGLGVDNHNEITPGIALDIATTYAQDGKAAAIEKCREYATQVRASVQLPAKSAE